MPWPLRCLTVLLTALPLPAQQGPYIAPPENLRRGGGYYLERSPEQSLRYTKFEIEDKVVHLSFSRLAGTWTRVEREETTPYFITCLAGPVSLDGPPSRTLYVAGTNRMGRALIERWEIEIACNASETPESIAVNKTTVFGPSTEVQHFRGMAAAPGRSWLLVQNHESSAVERIDTTTGSREAVLTAAQYPSLQEYDFLQYRSHDRQGHGFLLFHDVGIDQDPGPDPRALLIWDADLDGTPELVEFVSHEAWRNRGYDDLTVWEPLRSIELR